VRPGSPAASARDRNARDTSHRPARRHCRLRVPRSYDRGIWLGPEGAESGADGNVTDDGNATDGDDADGNETDGGNQTDGNDRRRRRTTVPNPPAVSTTSSTSHREADLVQLQNGETQLIDERELSVGTYRFLQLNVSNVDGTLAEGGEAEVDRPGNAPLTFNAEFDVRENTRTVFTADFAPVRRGNGRYLLRPVPSGIEVDYEETDGDGSDDSGNETE